MLAWPMRRPGMLPLVARPLPGAGVPPYRRMAGMRRFLLLVCAGTAALPLAAGWCSEPHTLHFLPSRRRCATEAAACAWARIAGTSSPARRRTTLSAPRTAWTTSTPRRAATASQASASTGAILFVHTRSLLVPQRVVTMGTLWQAWQRQSPPPARSVRRGRSRAPPLDLLPGTPLREVRSTLCRD